MITSFKTPRRERVRPAFVSVPTRLVVGVIAMALSVGSASAQCTDALPAAFLLGPQDSLLFYGDSTSDKFPGKPYHYAHLTRFLLTQAYCELGGLEIMSMGRRSGHWRSYRKRVKRLVRNENYDWIMYQDSGKAVKLRKNRFQDSVTETILQMQLLAPATNMIVTTTPPLDTPRGSTKWLKQYRTSADFLVHNRLLREIAADFGVTVFEWAKDTCEIYATNPATAWTKDGVHTKAAGDLLLAVATVKGFGARLQDLRFEGIEAFDDSLTTTLAQRIASGVYQPTGVCAGD